VLHGWMGPLGNRVGRSLGVETHKELEDGCCRNSVTINERRRRVFVIVSQVLPKGVDRFDPLMVFGHRTEIALAVAVALRQLLIESAVAPTRPGGQQTKMSWSTLPHPAPFSPAVQAIVESSATCRRPGKERRT